MPIFTSSSKWITGPLFLKRARIDWPEMLNIVGKQDDKEKRSKHLYAVQLDVDIVLFERFSNYYRFLKVMSWVRYAIVKFRELVTRQSEPGRRAMVNVTASEIKSTEVMICRLVQQNQFAVELKAMRKGLPISKTSPLFKLTPVLDDEGVIRLGGRIDNATCVPLCTKRPVVLPKKHALSLLIARHYHEAFHHQNEETIISAIRYKFWIPSMRRLMRSTKKRCQVCKNLSAVPETPLMGQIPKDRLSPFVRPFSYTGWIILGLYRYP